MKLLLHIGTEKTGTTLLQKWLYENKDALSKQGVFLSKVCGLENNRKLVSYCQSSLDEFTKIHRLLTLEDKAHFFRKFQGKFQSEVASAAKSHDAMVITSEHFHSRIHSPEEIAKLKTLIEENFESVKVVCYLRPQWDLRESLYSTAMKTGNTGPFEAFQPNPDPEGLYYNYFNLAEFWSGAFGKENLELRIFDRNKFVQGDLRKDFLTALPVQIDDTKLSYETESANESLSYLKSCAYRGINRTVPFINEEGGINSVNVLWKEILSGCGTLDVGKNSDPNKEEFYNRFQGSNAQLAREYFQLPEIFPRPAPPKKSDEEIRLTLEDVGKIIEEVAANTLSEYEAHCERAKGEVRFERAKGMEKIQEFDASTTAKLQKLDASATAKLQELDASATTAIRQRDHARRYPWKYLLPALKARLKK